MINRKLLQYQRTSYRVDRMGNVELPEYNLFIQNNVRFELLSLGFSKRQVSKMFTDGQGYVLLPAWVIDNLEN